MVATVLIREKNGAGETATDKTAGTVRFKSADNATADLNDSLTIPVTGQAYSFRKVLRLHISAGTFTEVSNLQVYSDGSNNWGAGIKGWYAITGGYTEPAAPNNANDPPQFPGASPMADLFGLTSGARGDMDSNNPGPFTSSGLPKDIGDYLNLVAEVEASAAPGLKSSETITFSYDEI